MQIKARWLVFFAGRDLCNDRGAMVYLGLRPYWDEHEEGNILCCAFSVDASWDWRPRLYWCQNPIPERWFHYGVICADSAMWTGRARHLRGFDWSASMGLCVRRRFFYWFSRSVTW